MEDCTPIDIRELRLPPPGAAQTVSLTVTYPDGQQSRQSIALSTTVTGIGAQRSWLVCPLCGRRAAKLYVTYLDRRLSCRVCRNLVYRSQYRKSAGDRALREWRWWDNASAASRKRRARKKAMARESGRISLEEFLGLGG